MRVSKKTIICNWKEYGNAKLLQSYIANIYKYLSKSILFIHCPPIHLLSYALEVLQSRYNELQFSSQIISTSNGTGCITASALNSIGCKYSLCGHSEYYNTDTVGQIRECNDYRVIPLACFSKVDGLDFNQTNIWIYEPVASIGTGKPASIADIQYICDMVRSINKSAQILYGGSVTSSNASEILNHTDGLCIGAASRNEDGIKKILKLM